MPTALCAAAWACLKHSAFAALDLLIGLVAVCAASDVARNGSKAIAKSVRVLHICLRKKSCAALWPWGAETGQDLSSTRPEPRPHAINGKHAKGRC